jgi:hypothetical protein
MFPLAIISSLIILAVAIIDGVRGKTGLGSAVLSRKLSHDKFWLAIALYANMALTLLWLSWNLPSPAASCEPGDKGCVVVIIEAAPQ